MRYRVNGGTGDKGPLVIVAISHLDLKSDLPGRGRIDPQGALGAVTRGKLPGAFKQDAVSAEIADDRCYLVLTLFHREREVLLARVWDLMPLLFPLADCHAITNPSARPSWTL